MMSSTLEKADNALLWVVGIVVALLLFGIVGAIVKTVIFAIKLVIVIAAIGVGVRLRPRSPAVAGGANSTVKPATPPAALARRDTPPWPARQRASALSAQGHHTG